MNANFLGSIYGHGTSYAGAVWDADELAPTLTTMQGGGREPHIVEIKNMTEKIRGGQKSCLIRQATKEGVIECMLPGIADLEYPNSTTRRGRVQGKGQICPTLTTENIPNVLEEWTWEVDGVKYLIRIRKLTVKECFRLMGVSDKDADTMMAVNSQTQCYKQAGNSIVVDVMENIFKQMIPEDDWSQYMNPPIEN